jgi:lipoprotein-anchoring transpeptidase ErfK/SrfK
MRRPEPRFRRPRGGGTGSAPSIFVRGGQRGHRRHRVLWFLLAASLAVAGGYGALVLTGSLVDLPEQIEGSTAESSPAERLVSGLARSSRQEPADRLGRHEHLVATAKREGKGMPVYRRKGDREQEQIVKPRRGQEGPLVFSVIRSRKGWLKVMLPIRPNGSTGWIRQSRVSVGVTDWEVEIDLSDYRVTARRNGRVYERWEIGLGQPETPTPAGDFYITELIRPPERRTIYGAYVFVLSGFSEKLTRYAGGNGELGLHGTNDRSGLGQDVSHGCIRMANRGVTKLAERLPLGTPVTITQ